MLGYPAENLDEAKRKLRVVAGLANQDHTRDYPAQADLERTIHLTSLCMHWGNEMVKHGAVYEAFRGFWWVADLMGIQPRPWHVRWWKMLKEAWSDVVK